MKYAECLCICFIYRLFILYTNKIYILNTCSIFSYLIYCSLRTISVMMPGNCCAPFDGIALIPHAPSVHRCAILFARLWQYDYLCMCAFSYTLMWCGFVFACVSVTYANNFSSSSSRAAAVLAVCSSALAKTSFAQRKAKYE